ncbi:MAG: tRNA (adenosine(37)-N6)-dimethylallyltransferase MiaA [Elusimicrobiota bacterium]|nr:tRNA (adenosine(37)-N6)-dimethylallyltransferase MiaA [Endomicrobiia bacterium]MDW8165830.1 tRNA (adenosine(37)-N6)-dimethylallyltransferase MiaA [Elusimicrobiota bacterium]
MKKIVILVGPTGVGKTEIVSYLNEKMPIEVISADSRQVYKYLSIGTNKPQGQWVKTKKDNLFIYKNTVHYLVDFLEPTQQYSAGLFYEDSKNIINKIFLKNKIPIIVGGTGLYIKTLTNGISLLPKRNVEIRNYLTDLKNKYGNQYLYNLLQKLDPTRAKEIHQNNIQRIIRSLEVILQTGMPFSQIVKKNYIQSEYKSLILGINYNKENIRKRIHERTEWMFKNGIIEETIWVLNKYKDENIPAFSSIGYKWIIKLIKKEIDQNLAKKKFIYETLNYIKRQITWFKKDNRIKWIYCDNLNIEKIVEIIYKEIIDFYNS